MTDFHNIIRKNRILAACKPDNLETAYDTNVSGIILMDGKLNYFLENVPNLRECPKPLFIHTDLIKGLSLDKEAFQFIVKYIKPVGIVSTKSPMIRTAKKAGILSIMRVFLIDTSSLKRSIQYIKENQPDAIEIMPGIAPEIVATFKKYVEQPIILGGLLWKSKQITAAINAGADAVSLSNAKYWDLQV